MIKYRYLFSILLTVCSASVHAVDVIKKTPHLSTVADQKVKNIILMIGDGMGPVHRRLANMLAIDGVAAMDSLVIHAQVHTASANDEVTDSAASATAMATGVKTNNKVIGLDAGLHFLANIIEIAQQQSKSTGIITTTQISHATPAAFSAHINSRYRMPDIARQQMQANIDVLMGGGENYFLPKHKIGCFPQAGKREDKLDLTQVAKNKGYQYICSEKALLNLSSQQTQKILGVFADEGLNLPFTPSLALMTQKSIERLSQDVDGFFLMVEGGQIDWASHANNAQAMMQNLQDFDAAVKVAREYVAKRHDTLLIVTADHETGGLSISKKQGGEGPFKAHDGQVFYLNWSTKSHTGVDIPLTAAGPNSADFKGRYENTQIFELMKKALQQ